MMKPMIVIVINLVIISISGSAARSIGRHASPALVVDASATWNASVTLDFSRQHPVSDLLYGIFFEEIGHAGDGGLYAELVQDGSFDALAYASGFGADDLRLPVDLADLAAQAEAAEPARRAAVDAAADRKLARAGARVAGLDDDGTGVEAGLATPELDAPAPRLGDVIVAWTSIPGTTTTLSKDAPLNPSNAISLEVHTVGALEAGVVNSGYWGVAVTEGDPVVVSAFLRTPDSAAREVSISIVVGGGPGGAPLRALASATTTVNGSAWRRHEVTLTPNATSSSASIALTFGGPGTLSIDSVSAFPLENVEEGERRGFQDPYPFRKDLLEVLKGLSPAFLRFPGGCYVEGDRLANAVRWKQSVGPRHARPGHLNGVWKYWSTDGLGMFETFLLAEELGAAPVWVFNAGVAHVDSVAPPDLAPWVQDALDGIEFATGDGETSYWGKKRAEMGRREPWPLSHVAIGNEDCGKPYYLNNYLMFWGALRARYPHLRIVSNCDMGRDAPTDLWDWHVYTNPGDMFRRRRDFDGRDPNLGHFVFASEYAVTDGGGWGNLIGAIAEAGFMTGLERNSQAVLLAAYAPLFVHTSDRPWPTNLIVIDNRRHYVIPSYWVQKLFRQHQGVSWVRTEVETNPNSTVHAESVAASATCQDDACRRVSLKLVNVASYTQRVRVSAAGPTALLPPFSPNASTTVLTSAHPEDENSFDAPDLVRPRAGLFRDVRSDGFHIDVDGYSVTVLELVVGAGETGGDGGSRPAVGLDSGTVAGPFLSAGASEGVRRGAGEAVDAEEAANEGEAASEGQAAGEGEAASQDLMQQGEAGGEPWLPPTRRGVAPKARPEEDDAGDEPAARLEWFQDFVGGGQEARVETF